MFKILEILIAFVVTRNTNSITPTWSSHSLNMVNSIKNNKLLHLGRMIPMKTKTTTKQIRICMCIKSRGKIYMCVCVCV